MANKNRSRRPQKPSGTGLIPSVCLTSLTLYQKAEIQVAFLLHERAIIPAPPDFLNDAPNEWFHNSVPFSAHKTNCQNFGHQTRQERILESKVASKVKFSCIDSF